MKIALVHDYLNQYGGAERTLEVLCRMFPEAPIYTLLYDERATGRVFRGRDIRTSFLQRIPFASRYHRLLPLLMPIAIEQFDLSEFDVVISKSASYAKGVITKPHTLHIDYCMTPTRYLWDESHQYVDEVKLPWLVKSLLPVALAYLRIWDIEATHRVDQFIANSQFIQRRISKYYRRDSTVIYPPVNTEKFAIAEELDDYFLMVGRLVAYKRFDLAVQVFNAIEKPLVIVGDGPERSRLERLAGPTIRFEGLVSDKRLAQLYSRAQAFIFPQVEDFGIAPLEAMASGRPVIAYRAGGALETVVEGVTGIFFDDQSEIALAQAIGNFYYTQFDPAVIRAHALRFDRKVFEKNIWGLIDNLYK